MSFSHKERTAALNELSRNPTVELLVIGGGVVGASIAAHAATLGLKVVLLEEGDFASGTSGQATGLAHAGFRYLAQGRLAYVFKEGLEVHRLRALAPHWVRPFDFCLPVYRCDPFPFWVLRVATRLYNGLSWLAARWSHAPAPTASRTLSRQELLAKVPRLQAEGLTGGTEFFVDARLTDSRFTLGFAQAAAASSARVLTYAAVTDLRDGVECRDRIQGQEFRLKPRLVINAAGPWIDEVRRMAGRTEPRLTLSQGIHLIVDRIADTPLIFMTETPGQAFFVLPYGSEASLIGTTDTPLSAPEEAGPRASEVDHLLRQTLRHFPSLDNDPQHYRRTHVREIFWGVRPLVRQGRLPAGRQGSTLHASRDYAVIKEGTLWSIPGVKLTAGRAVGEDVAAQAWRFVRGSRPPAKRLNHLPGGKIGRFETYLKEISRENPDVSPAILAYLVETYGAHCLEILSLADQEPALRERVLSDEPWCWAEAVYAARKEMVLALDDFLFRRTRWARYRVLPEIVVARASEWLGRELDWDATERQRQVQIYRDTLGRHRQGLSDGQEG